MFEEGDLDLLDLDSLGDDAEYFIHGDIYQPLLRQAPRADITYVALNAAIETLDDVRVRRAMQLALDRDSIMRITCSGRGTVENGIIPRGLIGHNPDLAAIPFDLKEAERLLDEAHVAVVPGSAFGCPSCIRLSYAVSEEDIRKAMARIAALLTK
jgi:ABC-type transport system substrate-binding protein